MEADTLTPPVAETESMLELITGSSPPVLAVLILLVVASIACWLIIGYKWVTLTRAARQSTRFIEAFWRSRKLEEIDATASALDRAPVAQVFKAGYDELRRVKGDEAESTLGGQLDGIENVERALRRATAVETGHLERLIPFLATVGSTAPFVGLFGTVWGIMIAFRDISRTQQSGLDVVSGPIAEALIATAIGLVAAIPAVIAYNFFNARIHTLTVQMENFSSDFLNVVKRTFFT